MNDNLIEAQYEVSKKSKIRRFYDTNKIFIYSFIFILIISLVSFSFYLGQKNKKKIEISENYIQAKIYLGDKKNSEAFNNLGNLFIHQNKYEEGIKYYKKGF